MAVALLGNLRSFLVLCLASVCCVSADVAADAVGSSMALAAASSSTAAHEEYCLTSAASLALSWCQSKHIPVCTGGHYAPASDKK